MASIPYPDAFQQGRQEHSPKGTASEPDAALVEDFYPKAKKLIVKGDYLRRKWGPRCGPRFYSLIKALRGHCSYEITAGEAMCFPSEETLACECGVTRRTILNWLKREQGCKAACGSCERCKKKGQFCHPRHGEALQKFLRIKGELRYDPVGKRAVKTSNRYFVRMDDPPVPEDEPLIWAKARELAVEYLKQQSKEQEREARQQEFETRAARAASSGDEGFTHNNVKKLPAQQCEKRAQDRLSLTSPINTDFHRSTQGEESAAQTIRSNQNATYQQTNEEEDEENAHSAASKSKSNGATAQCSEDQFRRAAPSVDKVWEHDDTRFQAAWEAAGGVISSLLQEYGDAPAVARRDTFKILRTYLAVGAPIERIAPLAYMAREQVSDFQVRGGKILNEAAYYVSTACNLARQARKKGWDVERIRKANLARTAKPEQQRQETRRPARRATPKSTRPTPAEAEALVMELGQRDETYAEAQAQVSQMEERRQAHEARQQVVRQQAKLFSQLGQAEEALKMFPEGSLPWERAQREKQDAERQIAALRKPADGTGV